MSSSPFSSVRYTYGPLQARNLKRNTPGFVLPPFIQRFLEMVTDEERRSALHRAKLDDLKLTRERLAAEHTALKAEAEADGQTQSRLSPSSSSSAKSASSRTRSGQAPRGQQRCSAESTRSATTGRTSESAAIAEILDGGTGVAGSGDDDTRTAL
ncbi:unnamed protein product [Tilletia controversa]|nr:unnamed protein product [Tilletia controversa]CAD6958723.1 unnamed protein product [Tilletia caries]